MPYNVWGHLHKYKMSLPNITESMKSLPPSLLFFTYFSILPLTTIYSIRCPVGEERKWINISPLKDNLLFWVVISSDPGSPNFLAHSIQSTCWILFIGSYSEGHCLKISALGVDFCCQKQQLLKSATHYWVIHKGFFFFPIWKTFVLPKSCLPPAWELTGFHLLLAGEELTSINYIL